MTVMEAMRPSSTARWASLAPLVSSTIVSTLLIVGGVALGYLAIATPLLGSVLPSGRPSAGETAAGVAVWVIALVGPAIFLLLGTSRLARVLAAVRGRVPRRSTALRGFDSMPDDLSVLSGLVLPDGRGVSNLVLGPFGAAVVRELPPAAVTRVRDGRWEARGSRGWIALENPLDRATRDAERVRRWLGDDDSDFIVKVYAAVVGTEPSVARTTGCAVLTPDQVVGWLAALPGQRTLTDGRRQRMLAIARAALA
jgi:hypothetical protein